MLSKPSGRSNSPPGAPQRMRHENIEDPTDPELLAHQTRKERETPNVLDHKLLHNPNYAPEIMQYALGNLVRQCNRVQVDETINQKPTAATTLATAASQAHPLLPGSFSYTVKEIARFLEFLQFQTKPMQPKISTVSPEPIGILFKMSFNGRFKMNSPNQAVILGVKMENHENERNSGSESPRYLRVAWNFLKRLSDDQSEKKPSRMFIFWSCGQSESLVLTHKHLSSNLESFEDWSLNVDNLVQKDLSGWEHKEEIYVLMTFPLMENWRGVGVKWSRIHQLVLHWTKGFELGDQDTNVDGTAPSTSGPRRIPAPDDAAFLKTRSNQSNGEIASCCLILSKKRAYPVVELERCEKLAKRQAIEQNSIKFVMAPSVPPGDIRTQPNAKIVFNAPYDVKHTCHIRVINSSAHRIGYGIKTTNLKRLRVDPPCGVLDPKETVLLDVSCNAFAFGQEETNNDRITVEWTNTPYGAANYFCSGWFQEDGMVRRKSLSIEYNI